MQFLCNLMLSYRNKNNRPQMLQEIIGDAPVVSKNHKLLSKVHFGTLRIMDTMRLMSLY